ncbi:GNAT family N-acetyltransferase [Leuconostoc palmae]|uniref:GNAT family N-acetyltransferase n=1 Tax=Leuconostoc palmae TaxID=501487 RepID=UPI001FE25228|nr:GNAT family protein [Leuconostoc palmae]
MEIGILIYQKHNWDQGIATIAIKQWLSELFNLHKDLPHIGLTTWSGNQGMLKVSEKAGLVHEGSIRQVRYWQGQYYDSVKYGILRSEQ